MTNQQKSLITVVLYAVLLGSGLVLWQKWTDVRQSHLVAADQNNDKVSSEIKTSLGHRYNVNHDVVKDRLVNVETDNLIVSIDRLGASIVSVKLKKYKTELNGSEPVTILSKKEAEYKTVNTGFAGDEPLLFSASSSGYEMHSNQDKLIVKLSAINNKRVRFVKSFVFKKGRYDIAVNETVMNQSAFDWKSQLYLHVKQKNNPESKGFGQMRTFSGFSYYNSKDKYNKIDMTDLDDAPVKVKSKGGWIATQQHYFITALIPPAEYNYKIYAAPISDSDDYYVLKMLSGSQKLQPNQQMQANSIVYVGPENADELEKLAPGLGLSIDYGWLWFISNGLFYLLQLIYKYLPNWGVAIILLTLLIKLAFYKLSEKSFKSMAKMRNLQPKVDAIKAKYPGDKEALAKSTMELYKQEKVNPMGGCLPILLQIPFFIALYWVLMESVELRHAPFFGWVQDLSSKDPYYILPVLMGLSMLWQQKLMPQQDPDQAKIMMVLPVVFTVMFLSFPSGLVLYWLTNNLLSILQQWYCMKKYS